MTTITHEPMCDVSPLDDGYNPFLLCDACALALVDAQRVATLTRWGEEQAAEDEAATQAFLRTFGMGSWLTRMDRRFRFIRVVGGVPVRD